MCLKSFVSKNKLCNIYIYISIVILLGIIFFICKYNNKKFCHISIDDAILIFGDLTVNEENYTSIFDNATLKFLKECNEKYSAKFSIYCFGEYSGISLSNCTSKFLSEFEENSDWLKFGFHAYDNNKNYDQISSSEIVNDYNFVMSELKRIVGEKSITTVVRLEKFICSKENILSLKNCEYGITGLLGSDTLSRKNYYLDEKSNNYLFNKGYYFDKYTDIFFYKTDLRIENINDVYSEFIDSNDKELIVFTHEWILNSDNKKKILEILEYASDNNYIFDFPKKYQYFL